MSCIKWSSKNSRDCPGNSQRNSCSSISEGMLSPFVTERFAGVSGSWRGLQESHQIHAAAISAEVFAVGQHHARSSLTEWQKLIGTRGSKAQKKGGSNHMARRAASSLTHLLHVPCKGSSEGAKARPQIQVLCPTATVQLQEKTHR